MNDREHQSLLNMAKNHVNSEYGIRKDREDLLQLTDEDIAKMSVNEIVSDIQSCEGAIKFSYDADSRNQDPTGTRHPAAVEAGYRRRESERKKLHEIIKKLEMAKKNHPGYDTWKAEKE